MTTEKLHRIEFHHESVEERVKHFHEFKTRSPRKRSTTSRRCAVSAGRRTARPPAAPQPPRGLEPSGPRGSGVTPEVPERDRITP